MNIVVAAVLIGTMVMPCGLLVVDAGGGAGGALDGGWVSTGGRPVVEEDEGVEGALNDDWVSTGGELVELVVGLKENVTDGAARLVWIGTAESVELLS